ncbi:hypothetical protein HGA88_06130 [Candidatus Roizmanbacteria bacterium]|nr:hypothetical protein [Candidatus Roizmanbacteria bacterium]
MNPIFLFFAYFVSRLTFISNYPYFYDSPEYLRLAQAPQFSQVLSESHENLHPLYLFFIHIFYHILPIPAAISFVSVLFGALGIASFYLLVKLLFGNKIAFWASLPLLFFPHIFLLQTNILHDGVDQSLFLAALTSWVYYMRTTRVYFIVLTFVFCTLSLYDYIGIAIWLPLVFVCTIWLSGKKLWIKNVLLFTFLCVLSILSAFYGIYLTLQINHVARNSDFFRILIVEGNELFALLTLPGLLRMIRNGIYILSIGYTPIVSGVILFAVYRLIEEKKLLLLSGLIVCFCCFFTSISFWHGGLVGRLGGLIGYCLALLMALFLSKKWYAIVLLTVIAAFCYTIFLFRFTPPLPIVQKQIVSEIPINKNDIVVISDYQRPQLEGAFPSRMLAVGSATYKDVMQEIDRTLGQEQNHVYITNQAATFPYWQYDGQMLHILSFGNYKKAHLHDFLLHKKLVRIASNPNFPFLEVYEIQDIPFEEQTQTTAYGRY